MENSNNYTHPLSEMKSEGGHMTSVKFSEIKFGDYIFDFQELGELLNELLEAKKSKENFLNLAKELGKKLSEGKNFEESYKEVYGVDIKK